jgi:hypothetical protein
MAAARGNGGPLANLGQFPLEQWFFEMPICTRWWTTGAVITSVLVQCHIVSPFNLFYSYRTVFNKSEVCVPCWYSVRSLTNVLCPVLAPHHNFLLLWAPESGPDLSRLLPPTLLTPSGREQRPFPRAVLLAPLLRFGASAMRCASVQHGLLGHCSVKHTSLCLEPAQPGHYA